MKTHPLPSAEAGPSDEALMQELARKRPGALRPWLLQIAHYRILNELRARSRRPRVDPDVDADAVDELPDTTSEPVEAAWQAYRQETVRAAVERLPPAQRQALSLAFFDELTHDRVAVALNLPLGTVKTRIRAGEQKLRYILAPLGVIALHNFAPAPAGRTYQAWVLHRGTWTSMGTFAPDSAGEGLLVAEGKAFMELPEEVKVTQEPRGGSHVPTGAGVIGWQAK